MHDGRTLTSADVKSTFVDHKPKRDVRPTRDFPSGKAVEAPYAATVIFSFERAEHVFRSDICRRNRRRA